MSSRQFKKYVTCYCYIVNDINKLDGFLVVTLLGSSCIARNFLSL